MLRRSITYATRAESDVYECLFVSVSMLAAVVRILVTFRESLLLVTGAADIRYLVLVTLVVTRSLKLLTHLAGLSLLDSTSGTR